MGQTTKIPRRWVLGGLAGLVAGGRALAADEPAWLPFELIRQKIFVTVIVNDVECAAFLDTGVSTTVIDSRFAEAIGIKPVRPVIVTGWGIEREAQEADGISMELAGGRVEGLSATVRDCSDLQRSLGQDFEVIVGRGFFDQFVVEIDFDEARLRVTPRKGFVPPEPSLRLALTPSGGQLATTVRLDGRKVRGAIDLGSSLPVALPRRVANRLGVLENRRVSSVLSSSLGGSQVSKVTSVERLGVGPYDLAGAPVVVVDDVSHEAILGLPVFSRFHVWFDYGRRQMWLVPGKGYWTPFPKNRVGLYTQTQDDGTLRITHVSAGSPADKAGFEVGERLKAPGTSQTAGMKVLTDTQIIEGAALRYELIDGTVRTLIAADYY